MLAKETIVSLRKSKGLTGQEVADAIGISYKVYQTYESGTRNAGLPVVEKLADFYSVTTDYLLGREPLPNPFADLNLSEDDEAEVIAKYMSLPDNVRACLLDVLVQLGDAARKHQDAPESDSDGISVSTTLGEIEDARKENEAISKDGA